MDSSTVPNPDVEALLRHWLDAGLISADQAERLRADVPAGAPRPASRGTSLVVEALGYLGGVLIMVALVLVIGQYWEVLSVGGRLGLTGAVTVLLLAAGLAMPVRSGPTGSRLRAVLWLAATIGLAFVLGLVGGDVLGWRDRVVATVTSAGTALLAAALWFAHRHPLQHLAVLLGSVSTVTAATMLLPHHAAPPELAAWGAGVSWAVLAWGGVLPPRRQGMLLGTAVTTVAAMVLAVGTWSSVLAIATVLALVAIAVTVRDLALLAVAALGALVVLPMVADEHFPGVLSAALVLLAVGLLLVGAAVLTARRRRDAQARPTRRDWSSGPKGVAVPVAAGVAVVVTTVVVVLGWA